MAVQNAIGRAGGITVSRYFGAPPITPGGRLSTSTTLPVADSATAGVATLAYVPYVTDLVPYWSATRSAWGVRTFTTLSTTITGVVGGTIYDVFLNYNESTNTSALVWYAWSTATARNPANAPTLFNGAYIRNGSSSDLWLGTFRGFGANLIVDSQQYRMLFNGYNKVNKLLKRLESANTWSPTTTDDLYNWFNSTNNRVGMVNGDPAASQSLLTISFICLVQSAQVNPYSSFMLMGLNVAAPGTRPLGSPVALIPTAVAANSIFTGFLTNRFFIDLGYSFIQALCVHSSTLVVWYGQDQGGLEGSWLC